MEPIIKIEHLNKIYELYDKPVDRLKEALSIKRKNYHTEYFALHDLSLEIQKGENIGIVGTNGAGKSTLLKIVTGVLTPTSGIVNVNGKISALLELGAGFNPEYTGLENIYLNGTMMGYSEEEMKEKVNSIIEFADIGEFINQPVKTYSSGMFARLAFAVAINVEPEILIIDEALSVGDVFFQAKCFKKMNEIQKLGTTIIIVSHDMGSIIKYCDRAILLHKGKLIMEDKAKKVVDLYKQIIVNQYNEEEDPSIVLMTEDSSDALLQEQSYSDIAKGTDIWRNSLYINEKALQYGNKKAEIIDIGIFDMNGKISNLISKKTKFTIKMKVKFNEGIDCPIFAYTIKDSKGTEITGTNTLFENYEIENTKAGEVYVIAFTQEMLLQGGEYLLSFGCTGYLKDEFVVYDRLYDITNMTVISEQNTVGLFDMDSRVSIKIE